MKENQEQKAAEAAKRSSLPGIKRTFMQKAVRRLANISGVTEQIAIETCKQAGYQMREYHYWWTNLPAVGEAFKLYSEWLIKGWWGPYGSGNMQIRGEVMRLYARANLPEDVKDWAEQRANKLYPIATDAEAKELGVTDAQRHLSGTRHFCFKKGVFECCNFYAQQLTNQAAEDFTNVIVIKHLKEDLAAKDAALAEALNTIKEREAEIERLKATSFQPRVGAWLVECFGPEVAGDPTERAFRFTEESLELVQSIGVSKDQVSQLVEYVYGRAIGETAQEVGGVMVTLAALCHSAGLDMDSAAETEYQRILQKIDKIRAKHFSKPKDVLSPIPGNTSSNDLFRKETGR